MLKLVTINFDYSFGKSLGTFLRQIVADARSEIGETFGAA